MIIREVKFGAVEKAILTAYSGLRPLRLMDFVFFNNTWPGTTNIISCSRLYLRDGVVGGPLCSSLELCVTKKKNLHREKSGEAQSPQRKSNVICVNLREKYHEQGLTI
jgi:hypothetical protein